MQNHLTRLRALSEASSKYGYWFVDDKLGSKIGVCIRTPVSPIGEFIYNRDAQLIAESRNMLGSMIDALEDAQRLPHSEYCGTGMPGECRKCVWLQKHEALFKEREGE